jgi:hypothetical protein
MFSVHLSTALAVLLCGGTWLAAAQTTPDKARQEPRRAVPGELIVKFKKGSSGNEIDKGFRAGRLQPRRHVYTAAMHERREVGLTLAATDLPIDEAQARLKENPAVEFVEPNYVYHHHATSNDPYVGAGYLWGLYGDRSSPTNNFGTHALEPWAAGYVGTNSVYVAVIDEGIDIAHPELAPNIWTNPFDPADGRDNDGNGYVDDVHGWNFADDTKEVFDASGDAHGTHVAGTIGAKGGNGIGIAGINWNVTIMAGKFLSADGGTTLDAVEAIDYFVDLKKRHGLNLVAINASWGGADYSQALHDAIIRAAKAGILFVAAAGNEALNNDVYGSYPANIDTRKGTTTETAATYDAVISVGAIDRDGRLASFSNYGARNVDLAAPGVSILSAYPKRYIGYMDGTSMATPHVTGAVALYASTHPGAAAQSIRAAIFGAVLPTSSLASKTVTGGRLNLSDIIAPAVPQTPVPAAPAGLTASHTTATVSGNSAVTVRWNASSGATSYKIMRATTPTGPRTIIATGVKATSYSQMVPATGTSYYYSVVATNSGGDSAESGSVFVMPSAPTPASLIASAVSSTQVQLRWTDRSSNEQGFKIDYWNGASWIQLGSVTAGSTSVYITGTTSRATYRFRACAYSGAVNTGYSNGATVTTP